MTMIRSRYYLSQKVERLEGQIRRLTGRVKRLEAGWRPVALTVGGDKGKKRIEALEGKGRSKRKSNTASRHKEL